MCLNGDGHQSDIGRELLGSRGDGLPLVNSIVRHLGEGTRLVGNRYVVIEHVRVPAAYQCIHIEGIQRIGVRLQEGELDGIGHLGHTVFGRNDDGSTFVHRTEGDCRILASLFLLKLYIDIRQSGGTDGQFAVVVGDVTIVFRKGHTTEQNGMQVGIIR